MKTFTRPQNQVLTEIFRRLNYFHKGNLNTHLLIYLLPSDAKVISKYNLIKPSHNLEIPRQVNWYNLTDAGKKFFSHYIQPLSEKDNMFYYDNIRPFYKEHL